MDVTKRLIARLARERTLNPLFEQKWSLVRYWNPVEIILKQHIRVERSFWAILTGLFVLVIMIWSARAGLDLTREWWVSFGTGALFVCIGLGSIAHLFVGGRGHIDRDNATKFVQALDRALKIINTDQLDLLTFRYENSIREMAREHLVELATSRLGYENAHKRASGNREEQDKLTLQMAGVHGKLREAYDLFYLLGLIESGGYESYYTEAQRRLEQPIG